MSDWADGLASLLGDGGDASSSVSTPDLSQYLSSGAGSSANLSAIDASMLGTAVSPEIQAINYTGPDLSNWLASKSTEDPSFLSTLANQLGVAVTKNPLSTIGLIVGALGAMRNSGADGANRVAAMTGVNNLVQAQSANPYTQANAQVTGDNVPTYHSANQFIVTPPKSTGPLTLIKAGGK